MNFTEREFQWLTKHLEQVDAEAYQPRSNAILHKCLRATARREIENAQDAERARALAAAIAAEGGN